MVLKILCASCSKEERESAESDVRRVLGPRAAGEAWQVSLVKMRDRWSVTLDGPGARAVTCLAPQGRLSETIRDALGGQPAPAVEGSQASGGGQAPGGRRDRHTCTKCQRAFSVTYEAAPGDADKTVGVACPHCWTINRVAVSESAADGRDYRAEKA
jgi:DNA-directed RNA polymerase subunit RPC12/RpoP